MKSKQTPLTTVNIGQWQRDVVEYTPMYALTYNDQVVSIIDSTHLPFRPRYRKNMWTQLGTARRQAKKYNKEFQTDSFGIAQLKIAKQLELDD